VSTSGEKLAKLRLGLVSVTIVFLTALALVLSIRTYDRLLDEAFRERSVAYAQAFAASAGTWLDPLNVPMLRAASQFLLVGSALYVQVALADGTVIDERMEDALGLDLATSDEVSGLEARQVRSPAAGTYLDIVAPLPTAPGDPSAGYIRMGIDASSVRERGRNAMLLAVALGIAIDLLLILLLRWAMRGRGTDDLLSVSRRETPIVVGSLEIDVARKEVRYRREDVLLTPKQFALLHLLAREPGRVYSEREIVTEVWAESPYADSKDVKQYVYLIRQRLAKAAPAARDLIVTVPGFGYRLAANDVDKGLTEQ
jgi:DNA-binding winged helix-turn-helix (wHTH) protein